MTEAKDKVSVNEFKPILLPDTKWKWDFLGDGMSLMIHLTYEVSWFRRMITRIVLGSKWTRIKDK